MKNGIVSVLAMLLLATVAKADILVTEVMYNPDQASDTDAEWIEIYNNGEEEDLAEWQLNGNSLEGSLSTGDYLVIAKELVDGEDSDADSFESIWGNNDGIWDENDGFPAIDGSFSLTNSEGSINLSNGVLSDYLRYSSSWGADGNGRSLEKVNLSLGNSAENWNESISDGGTPGRRNSVSSQLEENEAALILDVVNVLPEISLEILLDDMEKEGVQVVANSTRDILVRAIVEDENGAGDILNVTAQLQDKLISLTKIGENVTSAVFEGSFAMEASEPKQEYEINVVAYDSFGNKSATANFEFVGIVATILETTNLEFELVPGTISDTEILAIRNNGTASVMINLSVSNTGDIPEENVQAYDSEWKAINSAGFELQPGERKETELRIIVPNIRAQRFEGRVRVNARPL